MFKESELKKHISSGNFKNLYLIYGNEKMLVKTATNDLVKKVGGKELSEFNYHQFDNDSLIEDISIAVNVMPFVSPINIVVIKDMDFDSLNDSDFDSIMTIVSNVPDTTVLVITMPTLEVSEKKHFKKLIAFIDKNGIATKVEHRTELGLEKLLCKWSRQAGCTMTELTANKLISYCGQDLNSLHSEIAKLSAYADGEEITPEMIELLVNENLEAKVYDLFNYVITQDSNKAMKTIDVLFYQKEEPISIAIVLGGAYVDAYRARAALDSGRTLKEVSDVFNYKNREWVLGKISRQIHKIPTSALRDSIDEIINTQQKMVSISINSQIEIEKLVAKLIMLAGVR